MDNLKNFNIGNLNGIEQLNSLSPAEREIAINILKQFSTEGRSKTLEELMYEDYDEIPVDVGTFIHEEKYLGRALTNDEGKFTLYPYWEKKLKELFPNNLDTNYNTVVLTGCLSYDTEIPLLNGKNVKIGELAEKEKLDEYVYSYDVEKNQYVPGHLIKAFSTGVKPVYEIGLDNGTVIKATSNHKFMTRDKHWKSIDNGLSVGDSMMPFIREEGFVTKDRGGYEVIKNPNKDGTYSDIFTHRMVMGWKIGEYKGVVHHKDFDKRNNDPRNLLKTDWNSHRRYHAKRGGMAFKEFNEKRRLGLIDPEVEQRIIDGARKGCINTWSDPQQHKIASERTTRIMLDGLAKKMASVVWCPENREKNAEITRQNIISANKNPDIISKYQISKAIKIGSLTLKDYGEINEENYNQTKINYGMRCGYPCFSSVMKRMSLEDLTEQSKNYNHKIVYIKFVGYEKVFDLTVEKYHNFAINNGIVAHNSIGTGKSTCAVIGVLYELYRLMCLKDPYLHYGLQRIDTITVAFMNITLDAARGVAWAKCQEMIQQSDWFMSKGTINKGGTWVPPKGIELIVGSLQRHIIGRALFCCFIDEISLQNNQDVNKQIEKAKRIVDEASVRMQSRFMKSEKNPTTLFLASSKQTENSYLETFIRQKKKNESKTTLIVDEPQWVVRTDKDSPRKFKVALGNKFLESEVLPLGVSEETIKEYRNRGYTFIDVPMGYYESFIDDLNKSLTDIAGVSITSSNRFLSGARLSEIKTNTYKNPFEKEIIEVGNGRDDLVQYSEFFHLDWIDKKYLSMPLYIHLDMSVSGDKTGIAGVWVVGKKPTIDGSPARDLFYRLAFHVSVKAPRGHQISFEKNRNFIRWLKQNGFKVKGVSSDTYQAYDLQQQLKAEGFNCEILSMDRVNPTSKICEPYQYLKSTIYEKRLEMYENSFLTEELLGLEKDNNTGKIDHSPSGINSKDAADSLAGSIYSASKHAEEFAYNYGESYDNMQNAFGVNMELESDKQQIIVDFEAELQKMFNPFSNEKLDVPKNSAFNPQIYLQDGIIV